MCLCHYNSKPHIHVSFDNIFLFSATDVAVTPLPLRYSKDIYNNRDDFSYRNFFSIRYVQLSAVKVKTFDSSSMWLGWADMFNACRVQSDVFLFDSCFPSVGEKSEFEPL